MAEALEILLREPNFEVIKADVSGSEEVVGLAALKREGLEGEGQGSDAKTRGEVSGDRGEVRGSGAAFANGNQSSAVEAGEHALSTTEGQARFQPKSLVSREGHSRLLKEAQRPWLS